MALQIAYIALTLLMIILVIFGAFYAIDKSYKETRYKKSKVVIGLIVWQLYILLVSLSGVTASYDFPPRFALAFIFPSFIFTGIFLYKNRNHKWIQYIPQHWLIYIQSFRILVETLFVFSVAQGTLHMEASIEGFNYDMILAFTAPIIGLLVFKTKTLPKKWLIYWNYLGLFVLATVIFVFMSSIYKPEIYGSHIPLLPMKAFKYPYVLVAGFLMPLAVFIHVLSIVQLKKSH